MTTSTLHTEAAILQAIADAPTLKEQARLVSELDRYRAQRTAGIQAARDIDMADTIVGETLSPVLVHSMHTSATDWLDEVAPTDEAGSHQAMMAEASLWYGRVAHVVKADPDEFAEQARGMARRLAGRYGEGAEGARLAFLNYVSFLRQRESASGLPQVQQLVDAEDNPGTTPLPEDTFDTFSDPVALENVGVDEMQTSDSAPLVQEVMQEGSGTGSAEKPLEHDTTSDADDDEGPNYVGDNTSGNTATLALGHTLDLDQFKRVEAARRNTRTSSRKVVQRVQRQAASGLDQIEQVVDSDENPDTTDLPTDVAFPIVQEWPEMSTGDTSGLDADENDKVKEARKEALRKKAGFPICAKPDCTWTISADDTLVNTKQGLAHEHCPTLSVKVEATRKQADMFGNSDMTMPVGDPVATNPGDIPPDTDGGAAAGAADGRADALAGERPSFSDNSSTVDPYVKAYSEAYGETASGVAPSEKVEDVPVGAGPTADPNALGLGAASSKTSGKKQAETHPDYSKGYRYASMWKPDTPVVKVGSAEFEAGLYDGVIRNPNQKAWVAAHHEWARKGYPELAQRIAIHKAYTAQVKQAALKQAQVKQAETSSDLDTMDTDTYLDNAGGTPLNGPGTEPPNAGGTDPARPGGASPYNGAEPYGDPVTEDPLWLDPASEGGTMPDPQDSPTMAAFRKRVQASLVEANKRRATKR